MTEYILANKFGSYRRGIALVGVGGTGSLAAEGLCRLLQGHPQVELLLIDGDRVEERNLARQNFDRGDLGRFEAQALAERLARKYERPIAYSVSPIQARGGPSPLDRYALVIGAVDNAEARAALAGHIGPSQWWLDAGNGAEFGQVLVGNATSSQLKTEGAFDPEAGHVHLLPQPTLVRPELLLPASARPRPPGQADLSCAEAQAAGEQGPTINAWMATLVVEMVRRLLEGRLAWWQGFIDLEAGSCRFVCPTPQDVSIITRVRMANLVKFQRRRKG